jgi:hypothetical protein
MNKIFLFSIIHLLLFTVGFGQGSYNSYGLVISGGTSFSTILGKGEGDNYFKISKPGAQLEITYNSCQGFEWIIYGIGYYKAYNYVGRNRVLAEFWVPYYSELSWYQNKKKHPLFFFFGYDFVRMIFPDMEAADSQHYISVGGGWNIRLADRLYLQFKLKPHFILSNTVGQWLGVKTMINLHLGASK